MTASAIIILGAAWLAAQPPVPSGPVSMPQTEVHMLPEPVSAGLSPGIAPARDGNIAIREEFDAAVAAGTPAALELFIRRHPGHPLAALAAARLAGHPGDEDPDGKQPADKPADLGETPDKEDKR